MDELVANAVGLVPEGETGILYRDLLAAWPAEKRGLLPKVLSQARAENRLRQEVKLVDGKTVHTYYRV